MEQQPKRRMMQVRAAGADAGDSRWYAPGRDIAYITPDAFKAVFNDFENPSPFIVQWMDRNCVSMLMITELAQYFAQFLVKARQTEADLSAIIPDLEFMLNRPGTDLIAMLMLQKWMRAFVLGLRDSLHKGEETPKEYQDALDSILKPRKVSFWKRVKLAARVLCGIA